MASQTGTPVDPERHPRGRLFACFSNHQMPVCSISSQIDIGGYGEFIALRDHGAEIGCIREHGWRLLMDDHVALMGNGTRR